MDRRRDIDLDPMVVLQHLHEMGYRNITPQKLQEFVRDLKKLIVHDILKKQGLVGVNQNDETSSTLPNTTDESVSPSPPPHPPHRRHRHHSHHTQGSRRDEQAIEVTSSSSESSIQVSRRILRECTKLESHRNQDKVEEAGPSKPPLKPAKSCDCLWRRMGCKCCEENLAKEQKTLKSAKSKENLAPPRPKSSFIRTWQMTGQPRPGSASQRSDPVALYHQYQQVWKQQKLPGENNHNDLRWSIRERMLGQEPHPRPLSQASSRTSVSSRQKRL